MPSTADRFVPLARESQLQGWVADHGYPAPRVVALLRPGEVLDVPVQLVQWVPGSTLASAMSERPWFLPDSIRGLGQLHASLHAIPVPDFANSEEWSVLDRRLGLVRFVLERIADPALESALAQVESLRPRLTAVEPVLCHGDFHPMNLLGTAESAWVIDWTDAGLGDLHCDVARTSWLFRFAAAVAPTRTERAVLRAVAPSLARGYLRSYSRDRRIDPVRVRLWMPPHLLHAWAMLVADEHELVGASRAGSEIRAHMASWAHQQFVAAMSDLPDGTP